LTDYYFRWLANVIQMTHGSLPGAAKNRL
jgi:hypothetical protein